MDANAESRANERSVAFADAVIDSAGALVVVLDREGRFVRFNRACEKLSGYLARDVEGRYPWETVLPPEIADTVRREAFDALANNPQAMAGRYTNEWLGRDGRRHLIEWSNTLLLDSGGNMEFMVSVGVDVAAKKRAEHELLHSDALLTSIVQQLPAMVFLKSAGDLRFKMFNRAGEELLGFEQAALVGKSDHDLFPPEQAAAFVAKDQEVLASGQPLEIPEEAVLTRNGETRILRTSKIGIYDATGEPTHLLGVSLDITEQKRVQEVMTLLARAGSASDPNAFFRLSVRKLAEFYGARYAFIGLLREGGQDVETVVVWAGEDFAPNFRYNLAGTPCRDVLDLRHELIPQDAARLYSDDAMLVEMGVDSYYGTPLVSSSGNVMGLISVMDTKAMALTDWTAPVLGVFASRVAIELERNAATERLRELNISLEKRVAERTAELSRANDMLRAVLDTTPSRIFWKDRDGTYLGCNKSFAADAGKMAPRDIVGLTDLEMPWKASAGLYRTDDALVVTSGKPKLNFVEPMVMPNGSRRWLSTSKIPLRDGTGGIIGVLGAYDIITERKQLEDSLKETAARLKAAQQVARVGDFVLDMSSGELTWSDTTFELVGLVPGSVVPSNELFLSLIHPDDRTAVSEKMFGALTRVYEPNADGRARLPDLTYRVVHADGTVLWLHARAIGELDTDGRVVRVQGTVQDETARKLAEAELVAAKEAAEAASNAKTEFLSRMSHELRTPLNAVIGFAQVLEVEPLQADQLDFVAEIHRAGEHLLELINELLDLSRIESGRLGLAVQAMDLESVVGQASHIVQPDMAARQIVLLNECTGSPQVLADPTRLRQVLVNLLSNAIKYNREGGRITLSCQTSGNATLRLSVTDTGHGIPPEKLGLLFQPFERLGAEFTMVEGSGIGLALSKQLVELMGANIGVESTQGRGSTFWIDLPLAASNTEMVGSVAQVVSATATGAELVVIYVEDNSANLRVVEALFRHHPELKLLSATDGEFGLELARRVHPDVILLDIHLPRMDGYAVLKELQADPATRDIPVIALSADAMSIDIEQGLRAGFRRYLTKPVKTGELLAAISEVVTPR